MKLEVGMYARTNNGEIGKIRVIIDNMVFINTNQYYSNVVKASHTLLGNGEEPCLIEEGDYVNGMEVLDADWYNDNGDYEEGLAFPMYASDDLEVIENWLPLRCVEIKSIVTKEQFESMSYKVED